MKTKISSVGVLSIIFTTIISFQAFANDLYDPRYVKVFCDNESLDSESRCYLMYGHEIIFTTNREFAEAEQIMIQKARTDRHYIAVGNGDVYRTTKILPPDGPSMRKL